MYLCPLFHSSKDLVIDILRDGTRFFPPGKKCLCLGKFLDQSLGIEGKKKGEKNVTRNPKHKAFKVVAIRDWWAVRSKRGGERNGATASGAVSPSIRAPGGR